MKHRAVAALLLVLAACGQGGGGSPLRGEVDACALLGSPDVLFGAGAEALASDGERGMAGVCQLLSADGRRGGDIIVFTPASLGATAPAAFVAETAMKWDSFTDNAIEPVAGLGDEAQIATDMYGYQTQIVLRKGDRVALIAARSGDAALNGEALARRMAEAAAAAL